MSIMGGIGMLSAGLIGSPGLGYCKDRFSGEELRKVDSAIYEDYKSEKPSTFLNLASTEVFGLDGKKLGDAKKELEKALLKTLLWRRIRRAIEKRSRLTRTFP